MDTIPRVWERVRKKEREEIFARKPGSYRPCSRYDLAQPWRYVTLSTSEIAKPRPNCSPKYCPALPQCPRLAATPKVRWLGVLSVASQPLSSPSLRYGSCCTWRKKRTRQRGKGWPSQKKYKQGWSARLQEDQNWMRFRCFWHSNYTLRSQPHSLGAPLFLMSPLSLLTLPRFSRIK